MDKETEKEKNIREGKARRRKANKEKKTAFRKAAVAAAAAKAKQVTFEEKLLDFGMLIASRLAGNLYCGWARYDYRDGTWNLNSVRQRRAPFGILRKSCMKKSCITSQRSFITLSDKKFIKQFRLSKDMAEELIILLEPVLIGPTRHSALDATVKVLTALNFYGHGCYQLNIGYNVNCAISQPSVSRCIKEVTDALNLPHILDQFVKFPGNVDDLRSIQNIFYERHGFPGVIGCIDCTHVAIYPPKKDDELYPEHVYVNRKGYHSINVQLICDANLKIINVNARFPGSTNDSFIFNNSNVLPLLRLLHERNHSSFLLGDSGYPLRPWLMTPIPNAQPNSPEENYNRLQMSVRSTIERCNGTLKLRFRCLLKHRVLHYSPERATKIINACALLHNLCIDRNIDLPEIDHDEANFDFGLIDNVIYPMENINPELAQGRRVQQQLIRNYFEEQ